MVGVAVDGGVLLGHLLQYKSKSKLMSTKKQKVQYNDSRSGSGLLTEGSKNPSGKVRPYYVKHTDVSFAVLSRLYTVLSLRYIKV